jgi:hypothetical protein
MQLLMNMIRKLGFHKMRDICGLSEKLFASQEAICPMELAV